MELVLASAYSTGGAVGTVVRWALLIAALVATVRRLRAGRYTPARAGVAFAVIGALVVASVVYDVGGRGGSDPDAEVAARATTGQVHAGMIAGCTDQGQSATYCECVWKGLVDQGIDTGPEFRAMVDRAQGTRAPAEVGNAARACAGR